MFYPGIEEYRVRVELTESGFADRTATATYGTYRESIWGSIAAETGIEPIFPESESGVLPLHHSAIADAGRFELPSCSFGDCCVAVTPDICI